MGGQESKTRNKDEYTAGEHVRKIDTAVKDLSESIDGLIKDVKHIWAQINYAESSSVAENDYVVVDTSVPKDQEAVVRSLLNTRFIDNVHGLDEKKLTLLREMREGAIFASNKLKTLGDLQDLWIKKHINDVDNRPNAEVPPSIKPESRQENETHEQAMHSSEFTNLLDNYNRTEKELKTVKCYFYETAEEASDIKEENQKLKKKIEVFNNDKAQLAKKIAFLESQRQTFDEGMKPKHEKDKKITVECEQRNVVSNAKRQDVGLKPGHLENQEQPETCDTIPVQIFCRKKGDLTAKLAELLKDKFKGQTSGVTITTPETVDEIQDNQRLLVVCMHGSRLGTDTGTETQGIKDLGRTALLIFHHKDLHALPNQASARVLTETSFKELGGIFDFAFLTDKGIYECGMNTESTNGLVSFISKTAQK